MATPMLTYQDAPTAIAWLTMAFGFTEDPEYRYDNPDGTIGHAEMDTGDGRVMIASGTNGYESPRQHRERCEAAAHWSEAPWVIDGVHVEVGNVESHFKRSKGAGARLLSEIETTPFGRLYRAEDIEGHRWMFMQPAG